MSGDVGGRELNECAAQCNRQSVDEQSYWTCIETCEAQADARGRAGCSVVPTDVLERIGLALWSLMEDDGWTDDLLGLEPGDRLQIPGALTGRVESAEVTQ